MTPATGSTLVPRGLWPTLGQPQIRIQLLGTRRTTTQARGLICARYRMETCFLAVKSKFNFQTMSLPRVDQGNNNNTNLGVAVTIIIRNPTGPLRGRLGIHQCLALKHILGCEA